MSQQPNLKSLLIQFLNNKRKEMPIIQVSITKVNPIQISDCGVYYIELNELEDKIVDELNLLETAKAKLILKNWNFVLKRVPNSAIKYLDIEARNFRYYILLTLDSSPATNLSSSQRPPSASQKRSKLHSLLKK